MKVLLFAVLVHAFFVSSINAQVEGENDQVILLEDPPLEVNDWRAEYNASAAAAFNAYSRFQFKSRANCVVTIRVLIIC